ncbi:hypothetical protein CAPN004_12300 [Capnocytophaga cynodegmi]|nr:hypothetical protein CAPN004_12300 [Capnocytophaga cynodegmi]
MQKVQNVNRILFLFFLLGISNSIFSQKTMGGIYSYIDGTGEFWTRLELSKDGYFNYESGIDVGVSEYGKGHYALTKDSLILNYDLTEITPKGYYILKPYLGFTDSINLKINVFNFSKDVLKEAQVVYRDDSEIPTGKDIENGKIELTFKKQKNDVTLIFIHGESTYSFEVPRYSNFEIDVFLSGFSDYKGNAIKYNSWKYKIAKHKKDYLELQQSNGVVLKFKKMDKSFYKDSFE